jgi:hypothetical protein
MGKTKKMGKTEQKKVVKRAKSWKNIQIVQILF